MSSFLHSIRWRIQAWHGTILLLAISAFCFTAYFFAWDHQLRRVDRELGDAEHLLIRTLMELGSQPGDIPLPPDQLAQLLREREIILPTAVTEQFAGPTYFSIRDSAGVRLLESSNLPADVSHLPIPRDEFVEEQRTVGSRRESLRASSRGFTSVFGRDITPELEDLRHLGLLLASAGFCVWLLGLLGGWWLAGRAIQPVAAISRAASRIAEGNLAERIDLSGNHSELDQLARVLNQTFERLHASFERQRRFTADASHELRTPVSILIAETQRILKRDRAPGEYREAIQTCGQTADRMRRLIDALLILSRQEAAAEQTVREPCDLAEILRETLAQLHPLAEQRRMRVAADLQPTPLRADPAALAILASNLVRNAIQHQLPRTPDPEVRVSCALHGDHALLVVADDGPGIAPEDLPHIFERFYRADKARTGDSGHTGLGLAIAGVIAANHHGSISVRSELGRGAIFTVRLPAA
jgi:signal transduction histidine kinase